MPSIPQQILNYLESKLPDIKVDNGYDITVQEVNQKLQKITEVSKLPTINLYAGNAKESKDLENSQVMSVDIFFILHSADTDADKLITDVSKFLTNDITILSIYTKDFSSIPNLISGGIKFVNNNWVWNSNKKTTALVYNIEYLFDHENIVGGSVTSNTPNILATYTLTSNFSSSTSDLQNQINSLTGSSVDLSGYSLTSHSHNSFTSLTSNLLQSDNIILPSGASNNLPITFRRAVGTTGYEGFYSIGSGIGVITNYAYANAFMSTGFITKKLHLDTDMWQSDVNLYRTASNGLAFQTNSLDRFVISSGGNISITGNLSTTASQIVFGKDGKKVVINPDQCQITMGTDAVSWGGRIDYSTVNTNMFFTTGSYIPLTIGATNALVGNTTLNGILTVTGNVSGNNICANGGWFYGSGANTGGRILMDVGGLHSYANYGYATFEVQFTGANQTINLVGQGGISNQTNTYSVSANKLLINGLTGWSGTITASQTFTVTNGIITSVI